MKRSALATTVLTLAVSACTGEQLVRVVASDDPAETAKRLLEQRKNAYRYNPLLAVQDARTARRNFQRLIEALRGNVSERWGRDETLLPSRRQYVKYTQNYLSRAVVDFDRGRVTVETLDRENTEQSLQSAIVTTLLTPEDPRAVDLYSDRTVRLSGEPYLFGVVLDHRQRPIASPERAEAYARHLRRKSVRQRTVQGPSGPRTVSYVNIPMVADHVQRRARRYEPTVERYAQAHGVSKTLVFAVIKTESNFNPFAVSSAPAYGLMQLVPTSGGRDAYRAVKGRDGVPSRDYLFDPQNNIELGTAYLGLINRRYLGKIRNPVSREYCTIAAYNTGSGSVLRTFSPDRGRAVDIINGMKPSEVYRALRTRLHSREGQRYLHKVIQARKDFVRI